jgi:hypothetical protein
MPSSIFSYSDNPPATSHTPSEQTGSATTHRVPRRVLAHLQITESQLNIKPLLQCLLGRLPRQLLRVATQARPRVGTQVFVNNLRRDRDDVLALPVLDQIERLGERGMT